MSDPNAAPVGGYRLNTRPCDAEGQAKNWGQLAPVVNNLIQNFNNTDVPVEVPEGWVRFALTSTFTDQVATAHVFDSTFTDTGVEIEVYDVRDRYGAAAGNEKGVAFVVGTPAVYEIVILDFSVSDAPGDPGDDKLIACTADDSVADYFHASIFDVATYAAGADLIVKAETQGGAGTNQKERFSVDVSAIPSWSASGAILLGAFNGTSGYFTIEAIGSFIVLDETFIDNLTELVVDIVGENFEKPRLIRGQAVGDVSTGTPGFNINNVKALASGTDPTMGDGSATVAVINFYGQKWDDLEWVVCVYNEGTGQWETLKRSVDGLDGASGLYFCTLDAPLEASNTSALTGGLGLVYVIGKGGLLTELGARTIYHTNPYDIPGVGAQYPCAKTYLHHEDLDETEEDDEFTITGPDVLNLMKIQTGFAANKAFFSTTSDIFGMGWYGKTCPDE